MSESSPRIAFGLLGLIMLWVGVYWWWPTTAAPKGISFPETPPGIVVAGEPSPNANPGSGKAAAVPPNTAPTASTQDSNAARGAQTDPEVTKPKQTSPPPEVTIIPPEFIEHRLASGETYATLSLRYYGTSAYANAISRANPLMSPTSLRPGRTVKVPKDPKNIQGIAAKPAAAAQTPPPGSQTYTVEEGDTLSTISSKLYGESRYSKLIYEANRIALKDEHSLKIGQKLVIPPKP